MNDCIDPSEHIDPREEMTTNFAKVDPERTGPYTIASQPPVPAGRQRRSRWAEMLEECRAAGGEWRRISDPLSRATAAQIASDIRNAHKRDLDKMRLRGFRSGERWEAVWSTDPDDPDASHFYVWFRHLGNIEDAA